MLQHRLLVVRMDHLDPEKRIGLEIFRAVAGHRDASGGVLGGNRLSLVDPDSVGVIGDRVEKPTVAGFAFAKCLPQRVGIARRPARRGWRGSGRRVGFLLLAARLPSHESRIPSVDPRQSRILDSAVARQSAGQPVEPPGRRDGAGGSAAFPDGRRARRRLLAAGLAGISRRLAAPRAVSGRGPRPNAATGPWRDNRPGEPRESRPGSWPRNSSSRR